MPPGSGVPVPGANAGSSTSTSTVRNVGPRPTSSSGPAYHLANAEVANVVHEEARDSALGLPGELLLARPVAAKADLHVAAGIDMALLDQPVHDRPVRELDAEDLRARVGVRVEMDERHRAVCSGTGTYVRLGDRVVAAEHDRDGARGQHLGNRRFDRRMRASRIGRHHGCVAEVDDTQLRRPVDLRLEVRTGRAARGSDRTGAEPCAGPVGRQVVGRRADDGHVDVGELGLVVCVRHSAVRQEARVVRLVRQPGSPPAL